MWVTSNRVGTWLPELAIEGALTVSSGCCLQALRSTEEVTKEVDERSLYAAPFPFDTSLDTLTGAEPPTTRARCGL